MVGAGYLTHNLATGLAIYSKMFHMPLAKLERAWLCPARMSPIT